MRSKVETLEDQLTEIRRRMKLFSSLPDEDEYEDDTVILVKKSFNTNVAYTYTLLKIRGRWYSSGRTNPLYRATWERVLEFLESGTVVEMWIVSSWESML